VKRIGLISDTHGYLDEKVLTHFANCDEIWHAGDFGNATIAENLEKIKPLKGVYGNIDGYDIRSRFAEDNIFECENVKVFMRHIGGYPNRYAPGVKEIIIQQKITLFISGHSHILKVMYDDKFKCLHMNPGAAGKQGWHNIRTLICFTINGFNMKDCEAIELGKRS
jgi:uncharacterized protein